MRRRSIVLLTAGLMSLASFASAASTIERDLSFDARQVTVSQRAGYTVVNARGGMHEFQAGRPDLPWISQRIDLPPGTKVTAVEVVDFATAPLATGAHLAPAEVPHPGLGEIERSKPDPAFFQSSELQPETWVALGAQGDLRGRQVAFLKVAPARWNPQTGAIERVTSLKVRLTLDTDTAPPLKRERIVREWEDGGLPSGVPTRDLAAVLSSATPAAGAKAEPFRATQVPSVLGSPVAYVIVTNDAMAPTFQQLADWKTQNGVPAVVRTTSFIHAQYPGAADDAERIRLFLRDCYARWGTKWVLLGGDTDVIPVRDAATTFYGGESIASDLYYSCLDGNWNADGDSLYGEGYYDSSDPGDNVDLLPEVYVGRAPVLTTTDAQTFVNKTLQYERTPLANYENAWQIFAEVLFPQGWQPGQSTTLDGAELAEDLLPLTDEAPELHVGRLYENYTDPRWRPGSLLETRKAVIDSLNAGPGLAIHIGHGYRNVMEVSDGSLTNADALALNNGNKLFNLYAIDCTSNAIDFPCIGEAFVLNPNGGAVTNVGSTRFDFPAAGRAYQVEYFRLFIEDSVTAVGELQARQKLPFVVYSTYDGVNRWTQMTLLMLGDPELRIWRGRPRTLAVTAPSSIALSDSQFTVTVTTGGLPLANATVTAYRAGDDYRVVTTDAAGHATVPFRPDSIGSLKLTVRGFNTKPYQADVNIVATGAPVLVENAATVDDDNVGGTSGDGNASADAGETVDLLVPIRNNGGSGAAGVTANLSTTDPSVTVTIPTATYGTIGAGAKVSPVAGFRVAIPLSVQDQKEVPFKLNIFDNAGHVYHETFQLVIHAPELRSYNHIESEVGGNSNGRPDVGETVNYFIQLRNNGTSTAHGVTLKLRSADGLSTVSDSTASFGDIAPSATATGDAVTFHVLGAGAKLLIVVSDNFGVRWTQTLDLTYPAPPTTILGLGAATSIALNWAHNSESDLFGYNFYRSTAAAGPFVLVNPVPTDRISYYQDENLSALTRYYYRITAVDSSGNESAQSAVANASTNPPTHTIFPVPTGRNTPSSVALESIYSATQMDIVAGSDVLYVLHADGTAPIDADGSGATQGDFTTRGSYYAAGPSIANLDGTGWSIVAPTWDSTAVYVFDKAGNVRPGWPLVVSDPVWSSAACGDVDGDGKMELFFGSNGVNFYGMHANGTEIIDGDSNPATKGIFKVLGSAYNYGTPALADLDGDGKPEIIYGSFDGNIYAWKANGTNVPGFPFHTNGNITASVAVGYLDGPGDITPEIIVGDTNDSLYVIEPNGTRRPGFPMWMRLDGTSKTPSPALADMNGDGFLDIVQACTNGGIYVANHDGTLVFPWSNIRYSTLTSSSSESSPVVADINGDGRPDIVMGDENATLTAISGATATVLPGFPIQLQGEVRGTPAVADIDRDGKSEIVLAGWDKNIYVWDYDFPFNPSGAPAWPQFHHDARRTGFANAPVFVSVDDDPTGGSGPTATLEFAPPAPNPAHAGSRMWFGIPSSMGGQTYEFSIYDLDGRRVRRVDTGIAKAGRFSLQWDLRNDAGQAAHGGVYFARFTIAGKSVSRKLVVLQ